MAFNEIERIRNRCDPITQEAIDASLSYLLVWRARDIDLGAQVLARRSERGYPWDFDREHLRKVLERRKALRGAKPPPKPKQQPREPLAAGRTEPTAPAPPSYDFFKS